MIYIHDIENCLRQTMRYLTVINNHDRVHFDFV